MLKRSLLSVALSVVPFGATAFSQPTSGAPPTPPGAETGTTRLRIEIDPLVELYFSARAPARTESPALAGQENAVAAARTIQKSMGAFGGSGPLDSEVFTAGDATTLR